MDCKMIRMTDEGKNWTAACRGLARAFAYPDAEWASTLLDGRWPDALTEVVGPLRIKMKRMRQAIDALPNQPVAALRVLEIEYTFLFISAVPRVPAPPYASAYSGQGTLMGEPAEVAAEAYRSAGLIMSAKCHVLPDHVAAELDFLAWLGEQAIAAGQAGDVSGMQMHLDRQQKFLKDHVRHWMPEFCIRVKQAARLDLYRELARVAEQLLGRAGNPVYVC
jgi:putative dimethyl sulfoxide reductase chaperone